MTYNPHKEIAPTDELGDYIMHIVERQPSDTGDNWQDHYRLIENVLSRDEEVANCAVDHDGGRIYVALTGDMYDADDFEHVDARLREIIGKVATFNYRL